MSVLATTAHKAPGEGWEANDLIRGTQGIAEGLIEGYVASIDGGVRNAEDGEVVPE